MRAESLRLPRPFLRTRYLSRKRRGFHRCESYMRIGMRAPSEARTAEKQWNMWRAGLEHLEARKFSGKALALS
jgi:hypothetical protein